MGTRSDVLPLEEVTTLAHYSYLWSLLKPCPGILKLLPMELADFCRTLGSVPITKNTVLYKLQNCPLRIIPLWEEVLQSRLGSVIQCRALFPYIRITVGFN